MFSADLGVNQVASNPPATDPPFQKVALLLHGDGTNGAQNNTFVDSSTNNFTITRTGNVAQGTFSPFSLAEGQWSNYFDGTGDYLTAPDNTSLDMGSSSFTVEGWFYVGTVTGTYIPIVTRFNGGASAASNLQYFVYQSGSSLSMKAYSSTVVTITFSSALTVGNWYHFALVRDGNTISGYLNGVKNATTGTITGSLYTGAWLTYIGGYREGTTWYYANGYISNVRIVKGTALYTSDFTPPTSALTAITNTSLLTCQSNRFKDNSSNNLTITPAGDTKVTAFSPFAPSAAYSASTNGGSAYFNASRIYTSTSTNLDVSTGDFTVECWIYGPPQTSGTRFFGWFNGAPGSGNSVGWNFRYYSAFQVEFYPAGVATVITASVNPFNNAWNHIAFTRSGSTFTVWVNGVSAGTATSSGALYTNASWPVYVGSVSGTNTADATNLYITDARVIKGTALYTANFTPPTSPLAAVANTQLLLNCTNAGIIDNAGKNDIETVGNAQVSTSVKKYGTGSMYFDGTGDWLLLANRPELQLGTGNFTVEGWLYLGATGSARGIVGKGTSTTGWLLSTNSSNQVVFTYGSSTITSTGTLSGSTWYHIAVCREGTGTNQTKIYINGSNDGTGTVNTNFNQTNVMYVGANRTGGDAMNGYIDDLRITQGQALYTSNFTPPTQAFPNV